MASSGSFSTNSYDGRYLRFEWRVSSQSIPNNNTIIFWALKGTGGSTSSWYLSGNFKVVINGSTVYSSSTRIKLYNGTLVASGNFTINHNSDGSKSFSASAEAGIYYFAPNCHGSGSWSLPTIARATQPTTNKSTMYFGDDIRINLPRASSSFTHTIQAGVDGERGFHNIATGIGTSYTWTLPKSWASYIKTADKRLRIRALTYNGSSHIGTKEVSPQIKVKATSDMKPRVNISLSDENGYKDTYGAFIRGKSRIRARVTETLYRGTTVKSRSLTLNGNTYQTNEALSNIITSTSQTVSASVTDQRNMTGEKTIHPTVYDWYAPRLTDIQMGRCKQNGTLDDTGSYIRVNYRVDVAPIHNKNSKHLKVKYRKQGTTSWSVKNITLDSYTKTGHVIISAGGEYSWEVMVELKDDFTTSRVSDVIGTVYVLMDFHKSGKGMAIGKVSEHVNMLEVSKKWKVKVNGSLVNKNNEHYITKNKSSMDTNLNMNHNTVWNLKDPTYGDHAANKKYVDDNNKNTYSQIKHLSNDNGNFNDLYKWGHYLISSSARFNTWRNRPPADGAGICEVTGLGSNSSIAAWTYVVQKFTDLSGNIFIRNGNTGSGTSFNWSSWSKVNGDSGVDYAYVNGCHRYKYPDGRMEIIKWYKPKSSDWVSASWCFAQLSSSLTFPTAFANDRIALTGSNTNLSFVSCRTISKTKATDIYLYSKNTRDTAWFMVKFSGYWK